MSSNKQSGFNMVIGIIAIVLVVGAVSFIGWKLYNRPNTTKTADATTANTNSPASAITTTAATITPQGTYLDIKEFGIKIALNNSINDAVYAPFSVAPTDGSRAMGISTQSLTNTGKNISCTASNGPLGLIIETTNPTVKSIKGSTTLTPDGKSVFKIGSNYYRYVKPQADGCAQDQATATMIDNKVNAFEQAFTTTQAR